MLLLWVVRCLGLCFTTWVGWVLYNGVFTVGLVDSLFWGLRGLLVLMLCFVSLGLLVCFLTHVGVLLATCDFVFAVSFVWGCLLSLIACWWVLFILGLLVDLVCYSFCFHRLASV